MRKKDHLKRLIITAVYMGFGLLGAILGINVFRHYHAIVDGVLGLVVFYLLYQAFLSPRINRDTNGDELLEFPKMKYFLAFSFWTLIVYWAFRHISIMISSFWGK